MKKSLVLDLNKAKPRISKPYSQQVGRKAGKGAGHIVSEMHGKEWDKQKAQDMVQGAKENFSAHEQKMMNASQSGARAQVMGHKIVLIAYNKMLNELKGTPENAEKALKGFRGSLKKQLSENETVNSIIESEIEWASEWL